VLFLERVRGRVRVRIWINFECTCKFSVLLSKSVRMQRRLSLRIQKQLFHVVVIDRILFLTLFVCEREREKEVIGNTPNLKFRSFAPFQIPIGNIIIILVRERRDRERKYTPRKGGSSERTCCQNETKFCFKTFAFVLLMLCIVYEL